MQRNAKICREMQSILWTLSLNWLPTWLASDAYFDCDDDISQLWCQCFVVGSRAKPLNSPNLLIPSLPLDMRPVNALSIGFHHDTDTSSNTNTFTNTKLIVTKIAHNDTSKWHLNSFPLQQLHFGRNTKWTVKNINLKWRVRNWFQKMDISPKFCVTLCGLGHYVAKDLCGSSCRHCPPSILSPCQHVILRLSQTPPFHG